MITNRKSFVCDVFIRRSNIPYYLKHSIIFCIFFKNKDSEFLSNMNSSSIIRCVFFFLGIVGVCQLYHYKKKKKHCKKGVHQLYR